MLVPEAESGQIWKVDSKDCLLLKKIGNEWCAITLNRSGHEGAFQVSPRVYGYDSSIDFVPRCFYWVIPRDGYATFLAQNIPEYVKKVVRRRKGMSWNNLW